MFFQTDNDVLLCDAYIPQKNATQKIFYQKQAILEILKMQSWNAKKKPSILILGDLNTRTGSRGKSKTSLQSQLQHLLPEIKASPLELNRCSWQE